jgi:hypothetical protein
MTPPSSRVQEPASIGVEEPSQQEAGVAANEATLPFGQPDRAKVLLAGTMLGKEAGPRLGIGVDLDVAVPTRPVSTLYTPRGCDAIDPSPR